VTTTLRQSLLAFVKLNPGLTAYQIAVKMEDVNRLGSISATLVGLVGDRELKRARPLNIAEVRHKGWRYFAIDYVVPAKATPPNKEEGNGGDPLANRQR